MCGFNLENPFDRSQLKIMITMMVMIVMTTMMVMIVRMMMMLMVVVLVVVISQTSVCGLKLANPIAL